MPARPYLGESNFNKFKLGCESLKQVISDIEDSGSNDELVKEAKLALQEIWDAIYDTEILEYPAPRREDPNPLD